MSNSPVKQPKLSFGRIAKRLEPAAPEPPPFRRLPFRLEISVSGAIGRRRSESSGIRSERAAPPVMGVTGRERRTAVISSV